MKVLRWVIGMLAILPLAACALTGEAIKGRILEEGTNRPIPGAIVVVRWIGLTTSGSWFVEASTVCYHVETATTDEQGYYQTREWRQPQHKDYTVKFDRIGVEAYKPGYGFPNTPPQVKGINYLTPFKGSREERLAYLNNFIGMECGAREDYAMKLIPLYRALYGEARSIAITESDRRIARNLNYSADRLELGNDKADKKLFGGEYEKE